MFNRAIHEKEIKENKEEEDRSEDGRARSRSGVLPEVKLTVKMKHRNTPLNQLSP